MDRNDVVGIDLICKHASLSARRAWIEIILVASITTYVSWSLSARRAWIEMLLLVPALVPSCSSLSARRAWIEIGYF